MATAHYDEETAASIRRAETGESMANYPAIFEGFEAKGIATDDIRPRENVFTYRVWIAKGRQVRKGEHGVKVVTFIETTRNGKPARIPRAATVFHISQTDEVSADE